jgi:hypothetical protein
VSKLHDCKRGLSTATPADYNRWWRRMTALEAQLEAVRLCRRYSYEPLHATPMLCAGGQWMKSEDVLTAIGESDG